MDLDMKYSQVGGALREYAHNHDLDIKLSAEQTDELIGLKSILRGFMGLCDETYPYAVLLNAIVSLNEKALAALIIVKSDFSFILNGIIENYERKIADEDALDKLDDFRQRIRDINTLIEKIYEKIASVVSFDGDESGAICDEIVKQIENKYTKDNIPDCISDIISLDMSENMWLKSYLLLNILGKLRLKMNWRITNKRYS